MFKYLISGASEVHPRYADFIFNSFRSPENGLSPLLWNEKSHMFPSSRAADSSPFDFIRLVFKCHACVDPEGGGGGGG